MLHLLPVGHTSEIGASCTYLNIDGTGILIDSGIHPRETGRDALPDFDLLEQYDLDYVIITHAHQDHIGSLPYLVKRFPWVKMITTPATQEIALLTLHNAIRIHQEQLEAGEEMEVYTHEEVDLLVRMMETEPAGKKFLMKGLKHRTPAPVEAEFLDAGHILGSASLLLTVNGKRIYFTSDMNPRSQALLAGADVPQRRVDLMITESTLGDTPPQTLPAWSDELKRLAAEANKIINGGGSLLIPAFALGKTQELTAAVWKLMQKGTLAPARIITGGLGRRINRLYDNFRYLVKRRDPNFTLKEVPQQSLRDFVNPLELFAEPSIVIATSGMVLENTTSHRLAKEWLQRKDSAVFTVGYMDPETPGYRLANAKRGDTIRLGEFAPPAEVRCAIRNFRLTSHIRSDDLVGLAEELKPEYIVLTHGSPSAVSELGSLLLTRLPGSKLSALESGKVIETI